MNWTHVFRIAWKDYRRNGGLWFAFVAFWLLCLIYVTATAFHTQNFMAPLTIEETLLLIFTTAMIYALSWSAITFAAEHEDGTYGFLRALPVRAKQVFYGKLFYGVNSTILLVVTLCMICLLHASVLRSRGGEYRWGDRGGFDNDHIPGELASFEFGSVVMAILIPLVTALGLFWSLRLKRPLWALVWTGATAVLVTYVCAVVGVVLVHLIGDGEQSSYGVYASAVLLLTSIVLLFVDRRLVTHWLPNYSGVEPHGTIAPTAPASVGGSNFGRLFWLHRRQNFWICVGLGGAGVFILLLSTASRGLAWPSILLAAILSGFLGAIAFYHEHLHGRYRLLAQFSVSPFQYWASRLLVPGVAALAIALSISGVSPEVTRTMGGDRWTTAITLTCCSLAIFSISQFFSIACPSMIISIAASAITSFVACAWVVLCAKFQITAWLGCLPLVVLPLVASHLRVSRWFRATGSWKQWVVPAVPMFLLAIGVPVVTATYRVYEVPGVELPAAMVDSPTPPTSAEQAGAAAYDDVFSKLPNHLNPYAYLTMEWENDPVFEAWVDSHRELVRELVSATQRESVFPDAYRYHWEPKRDLAAAMTAGAILLHCAQAAIGEEDVDQAWEYLDAALDLARHQHDRFAGLADALQSFAIERAVYQALIPWAMMSTNTPEEIESAGISLDHYRLSQPSMTNALANDYRLVVSLFEDPSQLVYLDSEARQQTSLVQFMPWEITRAKRLVASAYANEFTRLQQAESGELDVSQLLFPTKDERFERLAATTNFGGGIVAHIGATQLHIQHVRRGILYQLAAIAHYKKHGNYPTDFSQLRLGNRLLPDDVFAPGHKLKLARDAEGRAYFVSHRAGATDTYGDGNYYKLQFPLPSFQNWSVDRYTERLRATAEANRTVALSAEQPSDELDIEQREVAARYASLLSDGVPTVFSALMRNAIRDTLTGGEDEARIAILFRLRRESLVVKDFLAEIVPLLHSENLTLARIASQAIHAVIRSGDLDNTDLAPFADSLSRSENSDDFGAPIKNADNGHYYELVRDDSSWEEASAAADRRTFRGRRGHLVTITSAGEEKFLAAAFTDASGAGPPGTIAFEEDALPFSAWAGGSDQAEEGVWKWVCGPETGEVFWRQDANVKAVGYANWMAEEPSQQADADFLVWESNRDREGTEQTRWRSVDRHAFRGTIAAYIVEYSGVAEPRDNEASATEAVPEGSRAGDAGAGVGDITP